MGKGCILILVSKIQNLSILKANKEILNLSQSDTCNDSNSDDESSSDEDDELEDIDEIVKDSEPPQKPEASYNKMYPPMAIGTLYSDMAAFKLALATHATKYEFHYNIEASDLC